MTIVHGNYEWDSDKNEMNIKKHGLSFEEILGVFNDPFFHRESGLGAFDPSGGKDCWSWKYKRHRCPDDCFH